MLVPCVLLESYYLGPNRIKFKKNGQTDHFWRYTQFNFIVQQQMLDNARFNYPGLFNLGDSTRMYMDAHDSDISRASPCIPTFAYILRNRNQWSMSNINIQLLPSDPLNRSSSALDAQITHSAHSLWLNQIHASHTTYPASYISSCSLWKIASPANVSVFFNEKPACPLIRARRHSTAWKRYWFFAFVPSANRHARIFTYKCVSYTGKANRSKRSSSSRAYSAST